MINSPVFFIRNVAEYAKFARMLADGDRLGYFFGGQPTAHPRVEESWLPWTWSWNPFDWHLRDMRLALSRVEGYRNFVTKLWNAARFLEMNGCARQSGFDPRKVELPLNRWITGATARAAADVAARIEDYRFNEAANAAYDFVWGIFCDWYLELAKPILTGENEDEQAETAQGGGGSLERHPILLISASGGEGHYHAADPLLDRPTDCWITRGPGRRGVAAPDRRRRR